MFQFKTSSADVDNESTFFHFIIFYKFMTVSGTSGQPQKFITFEINLEKLILIFMQFKTCRKKVTMQ